jgi:hypothetical protein
MLMLVTPGLAQEIQEDQQESYKKEPQNLNATKPQEPSQVPECFIAEKIDDLGLVTCNSPLNEAYKFLYSTRGQEFQIRKKILSAKYLVKPVSSSKIQWSNFLGQKLSPVRPRFLQTKSDQSKGFELDLYFSLLSYEKTDFETDGDNDKNIDKIKIGEDEFTTLPFKFTADFIFETAVLSISPVVTDESTGGVINLFHKGQAAWFGGFLRYKKSSNTTSREQSNSVVTAEDSTQDLRFGVTLRRNFDLDHWKSFLKFNIGYLLEETESTDSNNVKTSTKIDGIFSELYLRSHTKVTNQLFLGFGLGAFYGVGNFDFRSQNIDFVDNLNGFGLEVLPLSVLVSY